VQMGYARWVDPQHIEIVQPSSCSHRSHLVTQKPETLVQSGFEPVTTRSHPVVTGSHPVVTPMQSELTQPGTTACAIEAEEQSLPAPSEAVATQPASNSNATRSITDWDSNSPKAVEPEPPSLPPQPVGDGATTPQSHQRCGTTEGSSTPALEDREPELPPPSHSPVDDAPITKQDWKALLSDCQEAGMPWGKAIRFIADALGIPLGDLDPLRLTRGQLHLVMERLQSLQSSP